MKIIFNKIEIENFKPYRGTTEVSLTTAGDSSLTLVRGKNDRGKTAFLNAVEFCLYGFENDDERNSCINRQAVTEGDGQTRVRIEFERGGERYAAQRRFDFEAVDDVSDREAAGPPERTVERLGPDGDVQEKVAGREHATGYSDFIEDILPEEASQYFLFDGEELEEYANSFENRSDEVKDAIESLLGIKEMELASEDLRRYGIKKYRKELKNLISEKEEKEELQSELEKIEKKIKEKTNQRSKKKEKLATEKRDLEFYRRRIAEASDQRQKKNKIDEIKKEIEGNGGINDKIDQKRQEHRQLVEKMGPAAVVDIADEIEPDLSFRISEDGTDLLDEISDSDTCVCGREMNDEHRKKIEEIKLKHSGEAHQSAKELKQVLSEHVELVDDNLETNSKKISKTREEILKLKEKRSRLEDDKDDLREEIDDSSPEESELKEKRDKINQRIGSIQKTIESINEEIKSLRDERRELERSVSELEGVSEEVRRTRALQELAKSAKDAWEDIKKEYVNTRQQGVQEHTEDVFLELTNKPDVYTGLEITEDYQIELETPSGTRRFEEQDPSTGARQIIAYAFIAGLSKYSEKDAPVVADTPVARLDEDHRESLLKYFPKLQDQVVILYQPSEIRDEEIEAIEDSVSDHFEIRQGDNPEVSTISRLNQGDEQ